MKKKKATVKSLRLLNMLLQREMAERLSISRFSYAMKEKGKRAFTLAEINKICKIFKTEFAEIDWGK